MLSINLLPPEEKRMIRIQEASRAVGFFAMLALFVLIAGVLFLLPSFFSTYFARREFERSLGVEQQETVNQRAVRDTLAEAKKTKEVMDGVKAYAVNPSAVSALLGKFFPAGEGITITSLVIRKNGEAMIGGHAGTRDHLLMFEETLRASDRFLEVTFPLADIVRERDIQFAARAKLKSPYGF